jgi:hypothetical protein
MEIQKVSVARLESKKGITYLVIKFIRCVRLLLLLEDRRSVGLDWDFKRGSHTI